MPVRYAQCLLACTIAVLGGACASGPWTALAVSYEREVGLPSDLAAAIAAGALRHALPFADPMPQASGAPVSELGSGAFEVQFEQGRELSWVPCASHRATVLPLAAAGVRVHLEPLRHELRAFGNGVVARIHLRIEPVGAGSRVAGTLATELGPALAAALDRAFTLAVDPTAGVLGLTEPNLAALACDRLLARASEALAAGRSPEARAVLQRIERLGRASIAMQGRLGELAAAAGDHEAAQEHLWHAVVGTDDPVQRSQLAKRLAAVTAAAHDCQSLRAAARERFADADLAAAAGLLHSARREKPDPVVDYTLASQLHERSDDQRSALACALLAREYEPTTLLPLVRASTRWIQAGPAGFARLLPPDWQREPAVKAPTPWLPLRANAAPGR